MLLKWRQNLHRILRTEEFQRVFLAEVRRHDKNPNAWVVLDAFQKFFSTKNPSAEENFFIFGDNSCVTINREGIKWKAPEGASNQLVDDCEYSEWRVAQAVGEKSWLSTFLGPFPQDDTENSTEDEQESQDE